MKHVSEITRAILEDCWRKKLETRRRISSPRLTEETLPQAGAREGVDRASFLVHHTATGGSETHDSVRIGNGAGCGDFTRIGSGTGAPNYPGVIDSSAPQRGLDGPGATPATIHTSNISGLNRNACTVELDALTGARKGDGVGGTRK